MKNHLTPVTRNFARIGLDIRTKEQIAEDERREEAHRQWMLSDLASSPDYSRKVRNGQRSGGD